MRGAPKAHQYIHSYSVRGIYQVTHRLGAGSEGTVMRAFNINTGAEVAIKQMSRTNRDDLLWPILKFEALMLALIPDGTEGFPSVHYAGPDANAYVIVMDRLGPNLGALHCLCRGTFTLRTICMLADQMLDRIQLVHSRGMVSCDIKPHNFAVGFDKTAHIVHMFDFAGSRLYVTPDGEHLPLSTSKRPLGTARYASLAAHRAQTVSRADDIESLLYILLEFLHGTLPWERLPVSLPADSVFVLKADSSPTGSVQTLLARSPPEFAAYHAHVMGLAFGEEPDYALLRGLFRRRMREEGWVYDGRYDWMDPSGLVKGTLIPAEYNVSMDFVEDREWNPNYM
ncbi:hypothetical protein VTO73DRAFT_10733 [Trametes versicolor]